MAIDVLNPDPKEVYHKVRGNSLVCDIKGFFEDVEQVPAATDSKATRFFFKSLEHYDLLVWTLFLINAAYDGAVEATSMALRTRCKSAADRYNLADGPAEFGGLQVNGEWQTADFWIDDHDYSRGATDSSVIAAPGQSWFLAAHASWIRAHSDTEGFVIGRLISDKGETYDTSADIVKSSTGIGTVMFGHGKNNHETYTKYSMQWSFQGTQSEAGTAMILNSGHLQKAPLVPY